MLIHEVPEVVFLVASLKAVDDQLKTSHSTIKTTPLAMCLGQCSDEFIADTHRQFYDELRRQRVVLIEKLKAYGVVERGDRAA